MPPALVRSHVDVDSSCPHDGHQETHNNWTISTGPPHTTRNQLGQSPTPITFTSGNPTRSAHMRVASVSKQGLLETRRTRHHENRRAPVPRPGSTRPHPTLRSEEPDNRRSRAGRTFSTPRMITSRTRPVDEPIRSRAATCWGGRSDKHPGVEHGPISSTR